MVYLAYLGKETGIAKVISVILGITIVGVGCHSYFSSPWVKNDVHMICNEFKNLTSLDPNLLKGVNPTCPSIGLEKYFIVITLFCFTLSVFGLIGNVFTKQMSHGIFKSVDMIYHGLSGLGLIIGGSLYIYSAVKIDAFFNTISESVIPCVSQLITESTYQFYEEKLAAGSLSIINGLVYFSVALLMLIR